MKNWLKITLVLWSLCSISSKGEAQGSNIWWVLGNAGVFLEPSSSQPSLHFTLGEIMVEHFVSDVLQLSQGYHQVIQQVYWQIVPVYENNAHNLEVQLFPNPTSGILTVKTDQELNGWLFNSSGQVIRRLPVSAGETQTDLSTLPNGIYLLQFLEQGSYQMKTYKIQIIR